MQGVKDAGGENPAGIKTGVAMFSGGIDSTYIVAKSIGEFDHLILLTYKVPGMVRLGNAAKSFQRLQRVLGGRISHRTIDISDFVYAHRGGIRQAVRDNIKYRFFYSWCLGCKVSMHLYTIRFCKEHNIRYALDGSNYYDVHALEQHSDVKNILSSIYAVNGIEFSSPHYYEGEVTCSTGLLRSALKHLTFLKDSTEHRVQYLRSIGIDPGKGIASKYFRIQPSCIVSLFFNAARLPLKLVMKESRGCCYLHYGYLNYITDKVYPPEGGRAGRAPHTAGRHAGGRQAEIYLDNAATTRLDPAAAEAMRPFSDTNYGNASAMHASGRGAEEAIEGARKTIAARINADPDEIVFTSGGTESNNLAVKGIAFARRDSGRHIVISDVEHPSVREAALWLRKFGFEITQVPADREGFIAPEDVRKALRRDTVLVSVMHAQNEIGTLQPVAGIGALCREAGVYLHVDACQSFTKAGIDVRKQCLDLVSLNAHKLHGPRGVGALYIRNGIALEPLQHGGGQERTLRSGTYHTEGIAGFARAVELMTPADISRMDGLRSYCIEKIQDSVDGVVLNGSRGNSLCTIVNLMIRGVSGKRLCARLDERGIYLSTGSACSARVLTPSRVLVALGRTQEEAMTAIRISLCKWTTREEIDRLAAETARIVAEERGGPAV